MSRIWLDDVAEAISNAHCPNDYLSAIGFKNNLLRQLRDAALNGELACYNSVGKYKPRAYETLISTTKEAVNLWLKSIDSPYRYGQTEAVGDAETGNHAGTEPKERELMAWLRETWINEGSKLGGTAFFIKLKKYVNKDGSPIVEHYSAGKSAGFRWETSAGATGTTTKKTILNIVSVFKNTP